MYLICSPRKVITDHAKLLRSSKWSNDSDKLIQAHVELVLVLAHAQDTLDSRRYPGPIQDRRARFITPEVFGVVKQLDDWLTHWREETPELFSGLKSPHQYVYLYIMVRLFSFDSSHILNILWLLIFESIISFFGFDVGLDMGILCSNDSMQEFGLVKMERKL
ncbi:hypothetical protein DFH28DRAFT_352516 [Melampsora americana]|nr:hypothetical protein DFH28DRAFT_352516 [Melampsora americana]